MQNFNAYAGLWILVSQKGQARNLTHEQKHKCTRLMPTTTPNYEQIIKTNFMIIWKEEIWSHTRRHLYSGETIIFLSKRDFSKPRRFLGKHLSFLGPVSLMSCGVIFSFMGLSGPNRPKWTPEPNFSLLLESVTVTGWPSKSSLDSRLMDSFDSLWTQSRLMRFLRKSLT